MIRLHPWHTQVYGQASYICSCGGLHDSRGARSEQSLGRRAEGRRQGRQEGRPRDRGDQGKASPERLTAVTPAVLDGRDGVVVDGELGVDAVVSQEALELVQVVV